MELVNKIKLAILREEPTFTYNGTTYKLPSPQKCGTEWQKESYAIMEAYKIIDDIEI